jgi:hypothetical protein
VVRGKEIKGFFSPWSLVRHRGCRKIPSGGTFLSVGGTCPEREGRRGGFSGFRRGLGFMILIALIKMPMLGTHNGYNPALQSIKK